MWSNVLFLLLAALASPAFAQMVDEPVQIIYDLGKAKNITLNCTAPDPVTYEWKKNNTDIANVAELKDRFQLLENGGVFQVKARANEDDYGNYSCYIGGKVSAEWRVHAKPIAKLSADVNVVEGQTLKISCKVLGKPYPPVQWLYGADEANTTEVEKVLGERVKVSDSEAGVPGGLLEVLKVERSDAGVYTCVPLGGVPASTTLRVKGIYDALWPFLGICAEVLILCTIILVYEKRRNKPELEDSDADNHEQKKS